MLVRAPPPPPLSPSSAHLNVPPPRPLCDPRKRGCGATQRPAWQSSILAQQHRCSMLSHTHCRDRPRRRCLPSSCAARGACVRARDEPLRLLSERGAQTRGSWTRCASRPTLPLSRSKKWRRWGPNDATTTYPHICHAPPLAASFTLLICNVEDNSTEAPSASGTFLACLRADVRVCVCVGGRVGACARVMVRAFCGWVHR